jgi:serine/threonine protein kinase
MTINVAPGARLGPYDILAELGHGGMGVVYTATDPRLRRQVAIKLLSPDLTGSQPRARLQHTDNVEAYHLSLKGRHTFFRRTAGAMAQSKRFFEQALA